MAKLSPLMILPPVIFAAFGAVAFWGLKQGPADLPSTFVGQPAPSVTPEALPGYPALTPELLASGQVSLVNFWASWCPPCRAEHPKLLELQAQGIPILSVNFKDKSEQALKYLSDEGNPFAAVAFDPQGRTAIDWGVTAPPETFIIDGDGTVLFRFAGPLVGTDYDVRFAPALEKALAGQK